jgi:hypothetical protein
MSAKVTVPFDPTQGVVTEELQRLGKVRLALECSKLLPAAERVAAEEFLHGETEWPEYCSSGR